MQKGECDSATTKPARLKTIGVDGHVLTGHFQGTRTTLSRLLRVAAKQIRNRTLIVYADDPTAARVIVDSDKLTYSDLGHVGSIRRLLAVFPYLIRRDHMGLGVFQYMAPLTGRHTVFIHNLLTITHPHLFPLRVRLRTMVFITLSIWRASMVVAVNGYTRSEIARRFRLPPERLRTVLNGPSFDEDAYIQTVLPTQDRYILIVDRIEPRKKTELLVNAFRKANVRGLRLVIVGAWDPEFRCATIEGEEVEVRPNVDETTLIQLYREGSLFVYPSKAEGFGVLLFVVALWLLHASGIQIGQYSYFAVLCAACVVLVAFSFWSYHLLEQPCIRADNRLLSRLRKPDASHAPARPAS